MPTEGTAPVRWWLFAPMAVSATAASCVAGYLIVGDIHPARYPLAAYGLVVIAIAFAWSWAIQLLLDAARSTPKAVCGETHPVIGGFSCAKAPGHREEGDLAHMTDTGLWWSR